MNTALAVIGPEDSAAVKTLRMALERAAGQVKSMQYAGAGGGGGGVRGGGPAASSSVGSWDELRRDMREDAAAALQVLERERAVLLVRCATAEAKAKRLDQYVSENLATYQREIIRLREAAAASHR